MTGAATIDKNNAAQVFDAAEALKRFPETANDVVVPTSAAWFDSLEPAKREEFVDDSALALRISLVDPKFAERVCDGIILPKVEIVPTSVSQTTEGNVKSADTGIPVKAEVIDYKKSWPQTAEEGVVLTSADLLHEELKATSSLKRSPDEAIRLAARIAGATLVGPVLAKEAVTFILPRFGNLSGLISRDREVDQGVSASTLRALLGFCNFDDNTQLKLKVALGEGLARTSPEAVALFEAITLGVKADPRLAPEAYQRILLRRLWGAPFPNYALHNHEQALSAQIECLSALVNTGKLCEVEMLHLQMQLGVCIGRNGDRESGAKLIDKAGAGYEARKLYYEASNTHLQQSLLFLEAGNLEMASLSVSEAVRFADLGPAQFCNTGRGNKLFDTLRQIRAAAALDAHLLHFKAICIPIQSETGEIRREAYELALKKYEDLDKLVANHSLAGDQEIHTIDHDMLGGLPGLQRGAFHLDYLNQQRPGQLARDNWMPNLIIRADIMEVAEGPNGRGSGIDHLCTLAFKLLLKSRREVGNANSIMEPIGGSHKPVHAWYRIARAAIWGLQVNRSDIFPTPPPTD